jgi:hypothetical protein
LTLLDDAKIWKKKFHDYSFVVFPAAKAYEGFLKKLFLSMSIISEEDYFGKHFRIGKSLNPNLDPKYRDSGWVCDDLAKFCKNKDLPKELWHTWKSARNLVFHWFPDETRAISLAEAEEKIIMVVESIDRAFQDCSVKLKK